MVIETRSYEDLFWTYSRGCSRPADIDDVDADAERTVLKQLDTRQCMLYQGRYSGAAAERCA